MPVRLTEIESNKLCGGRHKVPAPCKLTFDLETIQYTSVPILVFLGLSVLDLGPMYATDRQTSDGLL